MTYSDVRRQLAAQRDLDSAQPSLPADGPTLPPPSVRQRLKQIRDDLAQRVGEPPKPQGEEQQ